MRLLITVLLVILCLLLFGFAIKNVEPVELQYYLGFRWKAPLSLMLLTSLLVGVIIGMIICLKPIISQRKQMLSLQRELKTLDKNNQS
ncbi:MAG: LapA family protein [Methylophilaceae bacterium]|jgi:putative membrane protein|nr:LapA family protein [Methylophilaceae bacterium]